MKRHIYHILIVLFLRNIFSHILMQQFQRTTVLCFYNQFLAIEL